MKRFFSIFFAGVLMLTGIAHGGESAVRFLRNDIEIILQDRPICRDGKWMVSLRDLERLTGTQMKETENSITLQKTVTLNGGVELKKDAVVYFLSEGMLLEGVDGGTQKLDGMEFYMDDTLYVRCREFAEALGYEVRWGHWGERELIELKGMEMPEITMTVEYDKTADKLNSIIHNKEPQTFLYGGDFIIEKKTEAGWERVKEAEPTEIDDVGYYMNATRSVADSDGISLVTRYLRSDLPAGEYRMGIPFSYIYHMKNVYTDYVEEVMKNGNMSSLDWNYYYSSHWGKPDFYFEGDGLSTYNAQEDTHYILYGEFSVE